MREKETDIQNERKGREKRKTEREMNRQQNGKWLKMETYQSKYTVHTFTRQIAYRHKQESWETTEAKRWES